MGGRRPVETLRGPVDRDSQQVGLAIPQYQDGSVSLGQYLVDLSGPS